MYINHNITMYNVHYKLFVSYDDRIYKTEKFYIFIYKFFRKVIERGLNKMLCNVIHQQTRPNQTNQNNHD